MRPFIDRVADFIRGRSKVEIDRTEAGEEDLARNESVIEERLNRLHDISEMVTSTTSEFSIVLGQLAKDLGYEDKRKGRGHAKTPGGAHKA
jgi:hypothetical protein